MAMGARLPVPRRKPKSPVNGASLEPHINPNSSLQFIPPVDVLFHVAWRPSMPTGRNLSKDAGREQNGFLKKGVWAPSLLELESATTLRESEPLGLSS